MSKLAVTKAYLDGQDIKFEYNDGHSGIFVRPPVRRRDQTDTQFYFILRLHDRPVLSYEAARTVGNSKLFHVADGYSYERLIPYMDAANTHLDQESSSTSIIRGILSACLSAFSSSPRTIISLRHLFGPPFNKE
jgi:hypothetical protein